MTLNQLCISPRSTYPADLLDENLSVMAPFTGLLRMNVWVSVDHRTICIPTQIMISQNKLAVKSFFVNPATGGDASIEMEYGFDLLSLGSTVYGTECKNYPPIDDSPQAGRFQWGKMIANIIAAVVVVAVIACLLSPALPLAAIKAGAIMAGIVLTFRAIDDGLSGNVSEENAYLFDGTVGFISGAGGNVVGELGRKFSLKFFKKMASSPLMPKIMSKTVGVLAEKAPWIIPFFNKVTPQTLSKGTGALLDGASGSLFFDLLQNAIGVPAGYSDEKTDREIITSMAFSAAASLLASRLSNKFDDLINEKEQIADKIDDAITGTTHGSVPKRIKLFEELTGMNIIGKPAELRSIYGAATNAELAVMIKNNPQLAVDALGILAPNAKLLVLQDIYAQLDELSIGILPPELTVYINNYGFGLMGTEAGNVANDNLWEEGSPTEFNDANKIMNEIANSIINDLTEDEILDLLNEVEKNK